jgi:hypothetical protein
MLPIKDILKVVRQSDAELETYYFIVAEWLRAQKATRNNFDDLIPLAQEEFGCSQTCVIRIGRILGIDY